MGQEMLVAFGLLILLAVGAEAGFRFGRRSSRRGEQHGGSEIGAIQGAMLGLLALLLGFSFAGAGGRFLERQDLIAQEANAIGTAYLRADLLAEPFRTRLRDALRGYTEHRLKLSSQLGQGLSAEARATISQHHDRVWSASVEGVRATPAAMVAVLPPVNEVIDIHGLRLAAAYKHLPGLIMGLLIVCSMLSMGVIGFGCGVSGRRNILMTTALSLLIAAALWTTIDFDYGRIGLIQLNDAPLAELKLGP